MRRVLGLVLCVAALAAVAGCGLPTDGSPRAIADDKVPFDILSPTTTAPSTNTGNRFATLYFVKEGHLEPEKRGVADRTPDAVVDALVQARPLPGSTSPVQGTRIVDTTLDGSTLIVILGSEINLADQKLAFGQLVWTATELSQVSRVLFQSQGADGQLHPLSPPTDTGNVQDRPVDRADYALIEPTTTTTSTTIRPGQTTTTRPRSGG